MSIDAIAILPKIGDLQGQQVDDGWMVGEGPGGGRGLWRRLQNGTLLNLGLSLQAPDGSLYQAARLWVGELPERIWVFPDTAIPEGETIQAVQSATQAVGRWVQADLSQRSILADLGFSPDEEEDWQRNMNSGNPERIQLAVTEIEKRLIGRDPKEVEVLLADLLSQG